MAELVLVVGLEAVRCREAEQGTTLGECDSVFAGMVERGDEGRFGFLFS